MNPLIATDPRSVTLARTSESHPLRIAEVECGSTFGTLGITFCPGKQGPSLFGAPWRRNLGLDLDVIKAWGAVAVVTLVETEELQMLGVPDIGDRVRERSMSWLHLPITDVQPPGPAFEALWPEAARTLHGQLTDLGRVLVHCRGGLGRAGTVAACILIELGVEQHEAIRRIRAARPGAIETRAQERYVLRFQPSQTGWTAR